jgi:hypothetical protein
LLIAGLLKTKLSPPACRPHAVLQTFDKKKLTSKLTFPEVLTLDPALQAAGVPPEQWPATPLGPLAAAGSGSSSSEGGPGALYDLQAVLLHKGNSASHGHYGESDRGFGWIICLIKRLFKLSPLHQSSWRS